MSESLAQKPVNMIFIVSQRALHAEHDIVCQTCLSVCLSVCLSICLYVCLSVCLSHSGIVSKQMHMSPNSYSFNHLVRAWS